MRMSLCMIVRQEEKALARCLEGIADAVEEIVIVDMGSTDRTKEIARQFTDKIYDFPWMDDFAAARNFAFSKGTGEYLLWMDAEDILPSGEKEKLLALKADLRENPCDMVMMLFDRGVDEGGRTKFSCYRERLVRRCPQARWQGRANERIPPFGSVRYEEIHFVRRKEKQKYSDCNLRIYEKILAEGEKLSAQEWFYYGRELFVHEKQEQAAEVLRKFLENPEGGAENKAEAVRMLATYMVEGGSSKAFTVIKKMMYAEPLALHALLDKLAKSVTLYLNAQIKAGAQSVMIFDTWGGVLTGRDYQQFSLYYMHKIVDGLLRENEGRRVPVTLFTKGGGQWLEAMAATGCDALGLDWTTDIADARRRVGDKVALQGNMDPSMLYAQPARIEEEVATILAGFGQGEGHVFNLGHGIHQDVPPEHAGAFVEAVHRLSAQYHK